MKKLLLFAAVAFSMNAMAQEETLTDVTPKAYDWANQEVGTKMVIKHADAGWNTDYTFSWALGGSQYLENEGCITANAATDPAPVAAGTAVVDLGEGIGKVMCINGANSKAQEVLGFTTDASIGDYMQINIFTNPDNTPKGQWVRCKIVLNIFSNTISSDDGIIANMYWMNGDNDNLGSWFEENKINSASFVEYDEEGDPVLDDNEDYVYDKNRWMTFTVDAWSRDDNAGYGKEGTTSKDIPMKWKIWMPGSGLSQATIFIKEIKFYGIDGWTDPETKPSCASPVITFGPCPDTSGVDNVTVEKKANDAIYNLAGQRVNKATRGVFIVNGKKIVK